MTNSSLKLFMKQLTGKLLLLFSFLFLVQHSFAADGDTLKVKKKVWYETNAFKFGAAPAVPTSTKTASVKVTPTASNVRKIPRICRPRSRARPRNRHAE